MAKKQKLKTLMIHITNSDWNALVDAAQAHEWTVERFVYCAVQHALTWERDYLKQDGDTE